MKMKKLFAICLVALSALISVHLQAQEVETLVLIDTDMGKIKVKLFNVRGFSRRLTHTLKTRMLKFTLPTLKKGLV